MDPALLHTLLERYKDAHARYEHCASIATEHLKCGTASSVEELQIEDEALFRLGRAHRALFHAAKLSTRSH